VFRLRGFQSGKYLRPAGDGALVHDDGATVKHLFCFFPGTGAMTGTVRLHHLVSDSSIISTPDGWLGCFQGELANQHWRLSRENGAEHFTLSNCVTGLYIFSNSDGRLGQYGGEHHSDQYFFCEDSTGQALALPFVHECLGLHDSGFQWFDEASDPVVYTDTFDAGRYIFADDLSQLLEVKDPPTKPPPVDSVKAAAVGAVVPVAVASGTFRWGTAWDLQLPEMDQPFAWAVDNIPLLQELHARGLVKVDHAFNVVYPWDSFIDAEFAGEGLLPTAAIRFALRPVSDGQPVPFETRWLRAWHGTGLHALPAIASQGLRLGKKGGIFLSPSFRYVHSLYSVPDLVVGAARFRLAVEVRVRPGSYREHGDHYGFCDLQQVENRVPENQLEWELEGNAGDVQVVGLVLKQLHPHHPAIRHDTNVRHACATLTSL